MTERTDMLDRHNDLLMAAMREAGLSDVAIENTGGGVMAVTGYAGQGIDTVVCTVEDATPGEVTYYVGIFPGTLWHDGPGEDSVTRHATSIEQVTGALTSARDLLRSEDVTIIDLLAWQYQIEPEFHGDLDIPVPGGVIRVSLDYHPDKPGGVYGGFYLDHPDGPGANGADNHPDLGRTITFTNAGPWDIDRIVAVLRNPDHPGREHILADYPS